MTDSLIFCLGYKLCLGILKYCIQNFMVTCIIPYCHIVNMKIEITILAIFESWSTPKLTIMFFNYSFFIQEIIVRLLTC